MRHQLKSELFESSISISRRRFMQTFIAIPILLTLPISAFASTDIHQLHGNVFIDNRKASLDTRIRAGSKIVVAHDGELVFSNGQDAFLLRGGTAIELIGGSPRLTGMRLLTGSVIASLDSRSKPFRFVSSVAIVTITSGNLHLAAEPHRLQAWLRQGQAEIGFGRQRQMIGGSHDTSYEIVHNGLELSLNPLATEEAIDDDLRRLESLVGR